MEAHRELVTAGRGTIPTEWYNKDILDFSLPMTMLVFTLIASSTYLQETELQPIKWPAQSPNMPKRMAEYNG